MKRFVTLNLVIKFAISLVILTALALRMDKDVVYQLIAHFKASAWLYAILLTASQFILLSFRWMLLLNVGKRHLNASKAIQINFTSQLANLVFITSVGGVLARIALSIQHGASFFKTIVATAFDRALTLAALLLLAAIFLPNLSSYVDNTFLASFAGYISLLLLTLFVVTPLFLNFIFFRLPQVTRLKGRWRYGVRYLRVLINNPVLCFKTISLSLLAQISFFLAVFCLIISSNLSLSFWQVMAVLPAISLVASLPISMGGWGVREGAFVYGLGLLGVPMETSFLISVQVGLIGVLTTLLMGMPALVTSDLRLRDFSPARLNLKKIRR
jgi:uncharacterized membrane protein YbhN (UPF0104 family)